MENPVVYIHSYLTVSIFLFSKFFAVVLFDCFLVQPVMVFCFISGVYVVFSEEDKITVLVAYIH